MSTKQDKGKLVSYEEEQIQNFKIKFLGKPHSWIETSIGRLNDIVQETPNMWKVRGRKEFDDYQKVYLVTFSANEQKYKCTCFATRYGYVREKEICTHIGSVILWRMMHRGIQAQENEAKKATKVKPLLLFGKWEALWQAYAMAELPILVITNIQIPISDPGVVLRFEPDPYRFEIDKIRDILKERKIGTIIHYFNPSGSRDVFNILGKQVSELYGLASANDVKMIFVTTISSRMEEDKWEDVPSNIEAYRNIIGEIRYVGQ